MEMKDLLEYPDYDSPIVVNIIDTMAKQIATNIDNSVVNVIHKAGIDIDKDKLVSAMKQDKERYEEAYRRGLEGGYNKRDSDIIRCKDCKHRPINIDGNSVHGYILHFPDYKCPAQCSDGYYDWFPEDDWYCANGEKKEDT